MNSLTTKGTAAHANAAPYLQKYSAFILYRDARTTLLPILLDIRRSSFIEG